MFPTFANACCFCFVYTLTTPHTLDRELKPHNLVAATAVGNRVFILSVVAKNSRTWQKTKEVLKAIQESFYVPPVKVV